MPEIIVNSTTQRLRRNPKSFAQTLILPGLAGPSGVNPNPIKSAINHQKETEVLVTEVGSFEVSTTLISKAIPTYPNHCYKVSFMFELQAAQNLISYANARVRRGNDLSGEVRLGPVRLATKAGTDSRESILLVAYDAPGLKTAQQWILTLQSDDIEATVNLAEPSYVFVEDLGLLPQ